MRFIGDIHGRSNWKHQIDLNDINVFVGDYFDSFYESSDTQIQNFREIVGLKRRYPDRVVLLIGNHDYHYLVDWTGYSGWSPETFRLAHNELQKLLAEGILQWTYKFTYEGQDWLVSHAGVSKTWMADSGLDSVDQIDEYINNNLRSVEFHKGPYCSSYGDNEYQGPLWIRPNSLLKDLYPINQIVGHTPQDQLESRTDGLYTVWFIDTHNEYVLKFENS